ncbi:MAG: hypothetical protein AB7S26_01110 [Sandaracinaceae bacterium]
MGAKDAGVPFGGRPWRLMGLAALLAVGSLTPSRVRAQEDLSFDLPLFGRTTFTLTNTSILRFRGSNYDPNLFDDDFGSLYERLDVALQGEQVRLETRLDTFIPHTVFLDNRCAGEPLGDQDPRCYIRPDFRPERLVLRWEPDDWTLEAGDSQIVIGRGLAMSFRKVDLLGVDNALRGGHVRYRGDNFRFGLHGGVANPQNQDPINLAILQDPEDYIIGGNVGVTIPGETGIMVGAHAVRVWFQDDETSSYRDRALEVAGWSVEAPALADGQLALYVEANGMQRHQMLGDEAQTMGGHGVYGSVQLQLTNLTLLAEWKDYTNFLVATSITEANPWRIYNASPAVEFDGPQRLRGIGNQRGGGLRMDYAFLPGPWSFSVNSVAYAFNEEASSDPWQDGIFVSHSWVTLAKRQEYGGDINWSLDFNFGSRFEVLMHDVTRPDSSIVDAGSLDRWMIHGRADLTIGSGDHSFDFVVDHRHERELIGGELHEFQVGGASVTYTFGVPLALTLSLRWTDFQQGVVDRRQDRDYNFLGGAFYPSFEGRWAFDPGTYVAIFVGQTPGGQLCSGGVCRDVPTFEGFRLEFVARL